VRALCVCVIAFWAAFSPAQAAGPPAGPQVVASVKPLHALVAGVMEGVGTPDVLLNGGGSLHAYALRPSEAAMLGHADVVFWVGPVFEAFLTKPLASLAVKARVVALIDAPGVAVLPTREGGLWEVRAEADHPDAHSDGHIWLSVKNTKAMVASIADTLADHDPANAARYRANAAALNIKLDALDADVRGKLAPVKHKPFIVFHDAYQYFEASYGLSAAGSITVSPDRLPGARRIAEIKHKLDSLGVTCVFAEPQFEPKLVQTVIGGTRARTGVLDPEGSSLAQGADLHFNLMRNLADGLVKCLAAP